MRKPLYLKLKLLILSLFFLVLGLWTLLDAGCLIRRATGVICPGCGMSRAWLAALRGNIPLAFQLHPMFWEVPVVILFGLYDFQPFSVKWLNILILAALSLGIVICYLLRLIAFLNGNLVI